LTDMTFPCLQFCPQFFDTLPHLMAGLHNLNFNNGLQYAKTTSSCPEDISCWHFISLLEGHLDNVLPPQGLSAPQVAQVLVNFRVCLKWIFANERDYLGIPDIHQSPITWCGTFHNGLLHTICHLLTADTVASWAEHCKALLGQGMHLTTGFLHYIGLLIWLFEDCLGITERDAKYCQPFICYDSSNSLDRLQKPDMCLLLIGQPHKNLRPSLMNGTPSFATYLGPNRSIVLVIDMRKPSALAHHLLPCPNQLGQKLT